MENNFQDVCAQRIKHDFSSHREFVICRNKYINLSLQYGKSKEK